MSLHYVMFVPTIMGQVRVSFASIKTWFNVELIFLGHYGTAGRVAA